MATNRYCIDAFLDELELKYFCRDEEDDTSWVLFFGQGVGLTIRLSEHGEFLLIRSLPLINLKILAVAKQQDLLHQLLKRNDKLKLGHYAADECVVFETSIPIEDGEFTNNQLKICLGAITHEICHFQELFLLTESSTEAVDSAATINLPKDTIDQLMDKLIEGPDARAD